MTKTILDIMGTLFLVIGVAGFVSPHLGGTHLGMAHNLIHIGSGALALWFGLKGTLNGARAFSWMFAIVYGLLGIAGMVFGRPGASSMMADTSSDPRLLTVIPNVLELGRNDHLLHIAIAIVFVAAALLAHPARRPATQAPPAA